MCQLYEIYEESALKFSVGEHGTVEEVDKRCLAKCEGSA